MATKSIHLKYLPFDPSKKHIPLKTVQERVFRKTSWIYKKMAAGEFPYPVQISHACVVWREEDIIQYLIDSARKYGSGVVGEVNS